MIQTSRNLPVATKAPLPPLGRGTVGPNISPYAVAAAQAKPQQAQPQQPQQAKPVVKAAPLAPVAPAKRYDAPYIPSIAPFGPPPAPDRGGDERREPVSLDSAAAILGLNQYKPAPNDGGYAAAKAAGELDKTFDKDYSDGGYAAAKAAGETSSLKEWKESEEYKKKKSEAPYKDSTFATLHEKLQSGDQYISQEDLDSQYASIDEQATLAMQEQMDMMDAQMAAMGLTGTGARGVAMGNIRAKILADVNDQKSKLWFQRKLRNSELWMQSIQMEMQAAMKEGDWDHAEKMQKAALDQQWKIEMYNLVMGGADFMVALQEKYDWEDGAIEALGNELSAALESGDPKAGLAAISKITKNANGKMDYLSGGSLMGVTPGQTGNRAVGMLESYDATVKSGISPQEYWEGFSDYVEDEYGIDLGSPMTEGGAVVFGNGLTFAKTMKDGKPHVEIYTGSGHSEHGAFGESTGAYWDATDTFYPGGPTYVDGANDYYDWEDTGWW